MSFMEVKPTPEYLEKNGVEPYFKVWSSVHEGWIYREKATDNQVSRGTYTTKEALLKHGTIEVWEQTNQQRSDKMSVSAAIKELSALQRKRSDGLLEGRLLPSDFRAISKKHKISVLTLKREWAEYRRATYYTIVLPKKEDS